MDCAIKSNDVYCVSLLKECGASTIESLRAKSGLCIQKMWKDIQNEKYFNLQRSLERQIPKAVIPKVVSVQSIKSLAEFVPTYKKNIVREAAVLVIQKFWRDFLERPRSVKARDSLESIITFESHDSICSGLVGEILDDGDVQTASSTGSKLSRQSENQVEFEAEIEEFEVDMILNDVELDLNHSLAASSTRSKDSVLSIRSIGDRQRVSISQNSHILKFTTHASKSYDQLPQL